MSPDPRGAWRPGDIVLSQRTGTVLEFLRYGFASRPVWMQLSPLGMEIEGYDIAEPVLIARRVGEKRMPVVDFDGLAGKWDTPRCFHMDGATWQGKCVDCGAICAPNLDELAEARAAKQDADHEPVDSLLPYFGGEDAAFDSWDAS